MIDRFQSVLQNLESHAGWRTNRINPPVLVLGNLDGVETGVRNLVRAEPLETETYESRAGTIVLPTLREMARIKSWLVVTRNATRDYIDLVALLDKIEQREGSEGVARALQPMNRLYPQRNNSSVVLQLAKQLAEPKPRDLADRDLTVYRLLSEKWRRWETVSEEAIRYGSLLLAAHEK